MNDFAEIENELARLRPLPPSDQLLARINSDLAVGGAEDNIIRPAWFRANWLSLGIGLAAAAVILIFARLQFEPVPASSTQTVATNSASPTSQRAAPVSSYIPTGATQVVYHMQDQGLVFPTGSAAPSRRVYSRTRETLQWHNPATGASLRVSYPTEQVELIPVSGQ
jgi:hypothetical protein